MSYLIDTDVMIHLRDGAASVWQKMRTLNPPFAISAIGRIELENGVYRDPEWQTVRRVALDKLLEDVVTLDLTGVEIATYRDFVAILGLSKRKVSDRITAATALVHDLTLVTMNGGDFRDVPGLKLEAWQSPT